MIAPEGFNFVIYFRNEDGTQYYDGFFASDDIREARRFGSKEEAQEKADSLNDTANGIGFSRSSWRVVKI